MGHYRSDYRNQAREALAAESRFAGFTVLKVWPGSIDADSLPVLGVLTPQDRSERDSQVSTSRQTLLQVAVRRIGGEDVEDILDEDSALIEAIVISALRRRDVACVLEDTSVVSNSESRQFVGTLIMSFRLQSWRPEATLP